MTAGHCVIDAANGDWYNWNYQSNTWGTWTFVPGYKNGTAPYGYWTAWQLWAVPTYASSHGDYRYDIGAAVLRTNSAGRHLEQVVGGQGLEWNWPVSHLATVLGYPQDGDGGASGTFTGAILDYCQGTTYADTNSQPTISCNMGHGASGGPWFDRFNGSLGYVDSVTSTGTSYIRKDGAIIVTADTGPYFGDDVQALYLNVSSL